MAKLVHRFAGALALMCLAAFFASTILVELLGSPATVARTKALIVSPGLWLMIPAIALTGASGVFLSRAREGRLVQAKRGRMPLIAANGLLVLVPCAIALNRWAAAGGVDATFYAVQALELAAGALNMALLGANARDGLRMAGRLRAR